MRLIVGETSPAGIRQMVLIETNIDDMNPQVYGHVMNRLFEAGARDVYMTPIYMKKNRPGTMLGVLALREDEQKLARLILEETSTLGMRVQPVERIEAQRKMTTVTTEFGDVPVKLKILDDVVVQATPEYDDCVRLATQHGVALLRVQSAATLAAGILLNTRRRRLTRRTGEITLSSIHATTILAVKRGDVVALAGDGQMTMGDIVLKHTARKIRRLYHDKVISGFAGAVADALQLFDKFESELERNSGNLRKSAVDLAKEWRTDRFLRRLEATLLVADAQTILVITGEGEVIEPDGDTIAIGSGGAYAQAAATALLAHTTMSAPDIARTAMEIAADLCIYTNRQIMVETMGDQT